MILMLVSRLYSSPLLKAEDLQGRTVKATIESVAYEEMPDGERKLVLSFVGKSKRWAMPKTSALLLQGILGDETDHWIGVELTLYAEPTTYRGRPTQGVRCRVEAQPQHTSTPGPGTVVPIPDRELPREAMRTDDGSSF